ncbi:hypothetical protein [Streptomyces sp. LaPpAH-108]|uniref:hypothetical protein n=1 Tax=Streptomyces sp. LaPpAH-108 TaxID=1155714 RepID=UPI00036D4570|nr:hypothetical protein [Streptomyces sp. LaPpAH-108]
MTASEVCDGTLDAAAQAALRRLSGVERFDEMTGTNEAGESSVFSVRYAVRHLHDEYPTRGACWVYKTGAGNDRPLLEIRFSAAERYPKAAGKQPYRLGVYAGVGRDGANVFFRCATKAPSAKAFIGDAKYVQADMYSAAGRLRDERQDTDRMAILGSMSRAVAREAGCSSEAGLGEGRTGS